MPPFSDVKSVEPVELLSLLSLLRLLSLLSMLSPLSLKVAWSGGQRLSMFTTALFSYFEVYVIINPDVLRLVHVYTWYTTQDNTSIGTTCFKMAHPLGRLSRNYNTQHITHNTHHRIRHTTQNTQHSLTTHSTRFTTPNTQHTTHNTQHTARNQKASVGKVYDCSRDISINTSLSIISSAPGPTSPGVAFGANITWCSLEG